MSGLAWPETTPWARSRTAGRKSFRRHVCFMCALGDCAQVATIHSWRPTSPEGSPSRYPGQETVFFFNKTNRYPLRAVKILVENISHRCQRRSRRAESGDGVSPRPPEGSTARYRRSSQVVSRSESPSGASERRPTRASQPLLT